MNEELINKKNDSLNYGNSNILMASFKTKLFSTRTVNELIFGISIKISIFPKIKFI